MKMKAAKTKTLDDLFIDEVADLYQAANRSLAELAEARSNEEALGRGESSDDEAKVGATHGGATRANRKSA